MKNLASTPPRRAVFLDRDGTLNEEVHYLSQPEQLNLLPTAAETIAMLNQREIAVVVITNQAGIARGIFTEQHLQIIHDRLTQMLAAFNAKLDGIYYCPHHPTAGIGEYLTVCHCRKPMPGMLIQAAQELNLDLSQSLMIGDRDIDLQAGANAGCKTALVRTGYGRDTSQTIQLTECQGIGVFDSVADAVQCWLKLPN